jgi:outer membrane protein OmpA-like peptidoglycan-associated protein
MESRSIAPGALALLALVLSSPVRAQNPAPSLEASPAEAGGCVGKARLRGLGFDHDGSVVRDEDAVILDLVAEVIRESCAGKVVVIEGHTDVSGSPEYNLRLSEQRAESVKRYLVGQGVPAGQLRIEAVGESRPLTTDPSPEAQQLNRRVTLRSEPAGS